MKKVLITIVSIILFASLVACAAAKPASTPTTEPTITLTVSPTQAPVLTPVPTPIPTPTPEPVPTSFTTGLPYDGEYQPVIAVIENSPAARPQLGLQSADIVYEVPVEGSITRFLCLFSDNVPEMIMPVRSARVPFLYIVHEYDAVFMHFGGSGSSNASGHEPYNVYSHYLRDKPYDVDGLSGNWSDYYYRDKKKSAPHNVVGNPLLVQQEVYDYQPEPPSWLFDENIDYQGESVDEINLAFFAGSANFVSYSYDEDAGKYLRFMGGKKFLAGETDEQISVTNLIVQYSTYTTSSSVKLWKMVGRGVAEFYIGGKKILGTWERSDDDSNTIFYDNNGEQVVLKPGNTWIHICPEK